MRAFAFTTPTTMSTAATFTPYASSVGSPARPLRGAVTLAVSQDRAARVYRHVGCIYRQTYIIGVNGIVGDR